MCILTTPPAGCAGERREDMKNYTKIDERHTEYGLFELWEHNTKGDTVPCIVMLKRNPL